MLAFALYHNSKGVTTPSVNLIDVNINIGVFTSIINIGTAYIYLSILKHTRLFFVGTHGKELVPRMCFNMDAGDGFEPPSSRLWAW